jgi:hypothetical protein
MILKSFVCNPPLCLIAALNPLELDAPASSDMSQRRGLDDTETQLALLNVSYCYQMYMSICFFFYVPQSGPAPSLTAYTALQRIGRADQEIQDIQRLINSGKDLNVSEENPVSTCTACTTKQPPASISSHSSLTLPSSKSPCCSFY